MVEAYDPSTGKTGPHTVTAVTVNRDPATEHLVLDTGSVETTPNHPFYTADRGWVEAGALRIGERIRTATGTDATVVSFTIDPHPASMWDITVAGAHSFFVGSGAVLVHNACPQLFRGVNGEGPATFGGPRTIDYRSVDGIVQPGYGPSAWSDPGAMPNGFVPHSVDMQSIPYGISPIQRGSNPFHYEMTPAWPMPEADFWRLLSLIGMKD